MSNGEVWGLFALWWGAPIGAGALAGAVGRRVVGRRVEGRLALGAWLLVPAVVLGAAGFAIRTLGLWDLVTMGLVAGFCAACVAHGSLARAWRLLPSGAVLVAGLLTLEAASRGMLPTPAAFPPLAELSFAIEGNVRHRGAARLHAQSAETACAWRFDPEARDRESRVGSPARDRPIVLHVGDSMTYGSGVDATETFVARLGALDPARTHVNAGVPGTSLDFQLGWTLVLTDLLAPRVVVLHVTPANDLDEIDRPYPCCDAGPMFDWAGARPTSRCERQSWRAPSGLGRWYIAHSPPPYPLRVATAGSYLARHVAGAWIRATERFARDVEPGRALAAERYEALLGVLRERLLTRGVELVLVILPVRGATAEMRARDPTVAFQRPAAAMGVRALDSLAFFDGLVATETEAGVYLDVPPGNPHFNARGHERFARWLGEAGL